MKGKKYTEWIKKRKNLLIIGIGLIGILLLVLSELPSDNTYSKTESESVDSNLFREQEILEKKLTELISSIDGTGKTVVLLTLDSDGEQSYAVDSDFRQNIGEKTTEWSREESYVKMDAGNADTGLKLKTIAPEVRGVAVVCEGGGNAEIKREITETVSAALGIGREKIYVAKMNQSKK